MYDDGGCVAHHAAHARLAPKNTHVTESVAPGPHHCNLVPVGFHGLLQVPKFDQKAKLLKPQVCTMMKQESNRAHTGRAHIAYRHAAKLCERRSRGGRVWSTNDSIDVSDSAGAAAAAAASGAARLSSTETSSGAPRNCHRGVP